MTPKDKNNLEFLMHASPQALEEWWARIDQDNKNYAFTLLELARLELIDRAVAIHDLKPAGRLIKQFTKKTRKK